MTAIAIFILIFTVLQFVVAFVNLVFIQRFPDNDSIPEKLVSVLIPARNEEKNIAALLTGLMNNDYKNLEIIIFNDQSTDKTVAITESFIQNDSRIKLLHSEGLPNGWLGKNHACHSLAKHAKGDFLLFLDADVRIFQKIISRSVSFTNNHKLGLLSVFPQQMMVTAGEKITVPLMHFILLTLLPLILVRKTRFSSIAAANGQFMLFNAAVYRQLLPHQKFKDNKVEDINTARYFKKNGITVACITGTESVKCRMYNGFKDAINGFSKNVTHFFGNSFLLAVLFWIITTFGFAAVYFGFQKTVFISYLMVVLLTRIIVSAVARQNVFMNLFLLVPQQLTLGILLVKTFINRYRNQYEWKGRKIS